MRRSTRILAVIVLLLGFLALSQSMIAQNVVLEKNIFVQKTKSKDSTMTSYEYQDTSGNKYPIYLSDTGKAYCWMKSKKTGKLYKRYLPKITAMLRDIDNGKYSR